MPKSAPTITGKTVDVQYYAIYRQARGSGETVTTTANTPTELYSELHLDDVFPLDTERLKVAVNDEFASWETVLNDGDTIVFIAPVAGG